MILAQGSNTVNFIYDRVFIQNMPVCHPVCLINRWIVNEEIIFIGGYQRKPWRAY